MTLTQSRASRTKRAAAAVCFAALALAGRLSADDRDFVRTSVEDPYVFIILDISGSMNWTTRCTAAQLAKGDCRQLCTDRDCFSPLNADDPASKFYQSKEALFEVLSQVDGINFGFATYNQDELSVRAKHWLYSVTGGGVSLDGTTFPAVGAQDVFGALWNCDNNGTNSNNATDHEIACYGNSTDAASMDDAWEMTRLHRLAKLGENGNQQVTVYVQSATHRFKVTYKQVAGETYGSATFKAKVDIKRCTDSSSNDNNENCTSTDLDVVTDQEITYSLVDQFLPWDADTERAEIQRGFYPQGAGSDTSATNTCGTQAGGGWDPNATAGSPPAFGEGLAADPANGYNLRFPTTNLGDVRGKWFYRGDVLPLDWRTDNQTDVLRRLAPIAGAYDQAPYFNDHPNAGESFLRLRDEANRPLLAFGSTPLGASIQSFRSWYAGCPQGNCPKNSGWKDVAATLDPNWGCRKKYLLVLTDGDETCGGGASACEGTASLRAQEGILTYVVAFGVQGGQGGGNTLTCMAANGGTGDPIYPQNKQELIKALTDFLFRVKEEARAFASAAVPSVEANVKDKLFLSDFTPISEEPIWDGHVDAFLKPLPERADGSPDDSPAAACTSGDTASCHIWDAGEELILQAPSLGSPPGTPPFGVLDETTLRLGLGVNERRVYYPGLGGALTLFVPPKGAGNSPWFDLFQGMGFKDYAGVGATLLTNKTRAEKIIGITLSNKTATIDLPSGGTQDITYVLGDVFHSDPLVTESPHDLVDFDAAPEPARGDCRLTGGALPGLGSSSNYRCFVVKEQQRRKLVIVGANDAQLHGFDAGTFDPNEDKFGLGTGREAFSVIPRMALPIVRDDAEQSQHIYGVDGPVVAGDVFFPSTEGGDDEWHTMLVVGMREGGLKLGGTLVLSPELGATGSEPARFGYMALDITQPDPLTEESDPRTGLLRRFVPRTTGPVPGCATLDTSQPPNAGCARHFPWLQWEFTDRSPTTGAPLDEDNNGNGDLGAPWSRPILTRVKLEGSTGTEIRHVVVVGGGLDAVNKALAEPRFGNFIYMLDARTGQPIYKREVEGSVPSIAVLDTNQDNVADFLYFGTTAGRVYKVDLTTPQPLENVVVRDMFDLPVAGTTVQRVTAAAWSPFLVFRTGDDHPIYEEIQLLAVHKLGHYALAFGTGDREDLWSGDLIAARFYVLLDEDWTTATGLTEDNYRRILPDDPDLTGADSTPLFAPTGVDSAGNPRKRGWYIFLDVDERVITRAFGVSGVLIFSSFRPDVFQEGTSTDPQCVHTGDSRNFVVFATSGNAVTSLSGTGINERYQVIEDFVTSPFVEQVQTQNITGRPASEPPPATPYDADCANNPRLQAVAQVLKANGPPNAQYGNYYLRLGQRESKLGVFYPACVPIAIINRNWKEN